MNTTKFELFIYSVDLDNLLNSSQFCNFVTIKTGQERHLYESHISINTFKTYLAEAILIMICYFTRKNIDHTVYTNVTKTK